MLFFHDPFCINHDTCICLQVDYIDFRCNLVNISHKLFMFPFRIRFHANLFWNITVEFFTTVQHLCIEFSNHLLLLCAFCGFDGTISFQVMISWEYVFGTRQILNKHVCLIVNVCIYEALFMSSWYYLSKL